MSESILWTVGHSNHSIEEFLGLLHQHDIEVLVDVRSAPFSRYASHFNRRALERNVREAGMQYLYLGRELGGRPTNDEAYDDEGHARYDVMAQSPEFNEGIDRLIRGMNEYRVAIMCSEEDPEHCHRRLLIGRVLTLQRPIHLRHIRASGSTTAEDTVELGEPQLNLLEGPAWRSTQSVSQRSRHVSSSNS